MLVLNRKVGESLVLNNVIRITILATEPNKVKIGIDAPADVLIVREELLRDQLPGGTSYPTSAAQVEPAAFDPSQVIRPTITEK